MTEVDEKQIEDEAVSDTDFAPVLTIVANREGQILVQVGDDVTFEMALFLLAQAQLVVLDSAAEQAEAEDVPVS